MIANPCGNHGNQPRSHTHIAMDDRIRMLPSQHQPHVFRHRPLFGENVLMPPLHIKLGLMKQFVKKLNQQSAAFAYLKTFFPKISDAKIKAGLFIGPEIKHIFADKNFPKLLNNAEKATWNSFQQVVNGFLGNNKVINYENFFFLISNFSPLFISVTFTLK